MSLKKPAGIVTIDIDKCRLRVALWGRKKRHYQCLKSHCINVVAPLYQTFEQLNTLLGIAHSRVITTIEDHVGIIKLVSGLGTFSDKEIWEKLKKGSQTYFQHSSDKLYMDFERTPKIRGVAVEKRIAENFLQPFKQARLFVEMLTFRQLALERAVRELMKSKKAIVVELRSSSIFFAVMEEGFFQYVREVSTKEVECIHVQDVANAIQQQYRFFVSSSAIKGVTDLVLCGSYENINDLTRLLQKNLTLRVSIVASPLHHDPEMIVSTGLILSYGAVHGC